MDDFWTYLDQLIREHPLVIDRPQGSHHPRILDLVYPFDYGYLDGTTTLDGEGIDVWLGSQPERVFDAVILTVDLRKKDAEIKLLLGCTEAEKQEIWAFMNRSAMRAKLIRREGGLLAELAARRSVRRFQPEPVPPVLIEQILAGAVLAPSAHNRQPWRFAVVQTQSVKDRLGQAMGVQFKQDLLQDGLPEAQAEAQVVRSRTRIQEAPALIVLCLDETERDLYPDAYRQGLETIMGVQSVAMAGENLLLAAHVLGLGAVWMCAPLFVPQVVRQVLELPLSWQPQGMVLLGYPAKWPEARPRHPVANLTRFL